MPDTVLGDMAFRDMVCEVCGQAAPGFEGLAAHLVAAAGASDVAHVMWLNRRVTKHQTTASQLAVLLARRAEGQDSGEEQVRR